MKSKEDNMDNNTTDIIIIAIFFGIPVLSYAIARIIKAIKGDA